MRFAAAILLGLTAGISLLPAQEATKPNTLTPKEIADGWILLFDGKSKFGWRGNGANVHVKDDALVVGSPSFIVNPCEFRYFELVFEYRIEGKGAPTVALSYGGDIAQGLTSEAGKDGWYKCVVHARYDATAQSLVMTNTTFEPGPAGKPQVGSLTFGSNAVWRLSVAGGSATSRLHIRNMKLRPLGAKKVFNGKDLTGWHVFPGRKSQFTVEDGAIVCKNGPGDLQSDGKYANFVLQLECKVNGTHLNSGIFFRCKANEYQNGYEAQIHNNFTVDPPKEYTVEKYDPRTHKLLAKQKVQSAAKDYGTGAVYRRVPARKGVAKDGEWFTMTIVAQGNHFATWVNGIQQVDWYDNRPASDNPRTGCRLEAGHISIQGHDPTTNLSFRNIRIAELPSTSK